MNNNRNARKVYEDYIKRMNDEETTRELIEYQNYADCFAIMEIKTKLIRLPEREIKDYMLIKLDYDGNIKPIRTYCDLHEAKIALLALAYKSKPIIQLPF